MADEQTQAENSNDMATDPPPHQDVATLPPTQAQPAEEPGPVPETIPPITQIAPTSRTSPPPPPPVQPPELPPPTILPPLPLPTGFSSRQNSLLGGPMGSLPGTPASFAESGAPTPSLPVPSSAAAPTSPGARPLNVKDALSYLEMVKVKFNDHPDVYNHFLDIMKDFKSQAIDTPGVIDRVSTLFTGHPSLIQGFNTFLPQGYRIECSQDGQDTNVIVTTPSGTTTTTSGIAMNNLSRAASGISSMPGPNSIPWATNAPPSITGSGPYPPDPMPSLFAQGDSKMHGHSAPNNSQPEFNHAIQFVNRIKTRFAQETDTYKQFLEILQKYQKEQRPYQEVYQQVTILFKGAPDLIEEFKQFLPDPTGNHPSSSGLFGMLAGAGELGKGEMDQERSLDKKKTGSNIADKSAPPPKRKKRVLEKEVPPPKPIQPKAKRSKLHHNKGGEPQSPTYAPAASPVPHIPNGNGSYHHHHQSSHTNGASAAGVPDEAAFFDRVKKYIDDKQAYQDFLKLLNLFTQEIIDIRVLVERAYYFLGDGELMQQLKDILGFDDRNLVEVEGGLKGVAGVVSALDRPKVDLNACKKYGPSYRQLPKNEVSLACSGRDAMCWEVLNDEWVSHPTWASEDTGFSTHKKNVYEEALHKSEEERHEYDFHVEAIVRTIQVLEPIQARINLMDAEERTVFKLKPGLGGQGKSVYQRVIKKIYGKEHGLEIIQALHESPSIAVPVVLNRLKQKDEEWKRAQREWNKVWREVDARNYYKSLDHQGVNFKVNDKKTVVARQLIQDIEAKRKEQVKERAKLIDPLFARTLPKDHFAFKLDDPAVLQDCVKLATTFLDRTSVVQFSRSDKTQIESFLHTFIPLFFMLDVNEFEASFSKTDTAGPGFANFLSNPLSGTRSDDLESEASDSAMDEGDDSISVGSSKRVNGSKKTNGVASADLRKRLLKSGAQRSSGRKGTPSQTPSRASPAPAAPDAMVIDSEPSEAGPLSSSPMNQPDGNPAVGAFSSGGESWVKYDSADADAKKASAFKAPAKDATGRKANFFANNAFYVLLRQLQILYQRLYMCKSIAQEMAVDQSQSYLTNPVAVELGLHDSTGPGQSRLITSGPNPAKHFYSYLLWCCEQLFDNQMDQNLFEDNLRFMFGIKAYLLFTVDKVVAAIIKQVQAIVSDSKSQDLLAMLQKERALESFTNQQLINYRREAESIVGADENVYRICWLVPTNIMQIQLLGKDDISTDDATTLTERWRHYIESYTLPHQTEGLGIDVKTPLLKRCTDPEQDGPLPATSYISVARLQIKVCIRTYRLFFVAGTEDFYWRKRPEEEISTIHAQAVEEKAKRKESFMAWLDSKVVPPAKEPEPSEPSKVEMEEDEKPSIDAPAANVTTLTA